MDFELVFSMGSSHVFSEQNLIAPRLFPAFAHFLYLRQGLPRREPRVSSKIFQECSEKCYTLALTPFILKCSACKARLSHVGYPRALHKSVLPKFLDTLNPPLARLANKRQLAKMSKEHLLQVVVSSLLHRTVPPRLVHTCFAHKDFWVPCLFSCSCEI